MRDSDSADGRRPTRSPAAGRRRLLAVVGLGAGTVLAGCTGGDGAPYGPRQSVDVDGEGRTARELVAAERLAEREISDSVTPLESVSLVDHAFVLEDGYEGSTVQGVVENAGEERLELVEVRARVYDDAGDQLGRYVARTGELAAGDRWAFTVIVLQAPADVAAYDVAALGTPS